MISSYSNTDDQPYRIHPIYQSLLNPKELNQNISLNVPPGDRVAILEAMIISFVCEKRQPLSLTGDIVTLSRELTKDTKTFSKIKLKRTVAQNKLQLGVALSMLNKIRSTYFSLNLDEATRSNHHRVSYFSKVKKVVVFEHFASTDAPITITENILNTLINLFKEKSTP